MKIASEAGMALKKMCVY